MSIAAMRQALEAMESTGMFPASQDALRTAIAEQEKVEPVAWMQSNHLSQLSNKHCGSDMMLARCSSRKAMDDFIPLYTHPAPAPAERKPNRYHSDYEEGCVDGWNDCRKAMLSSAPKPENSHD